MNPPMIEQTQTQQDGDEPISEWVRKLAEGDSQAQKNIWKSYVRRLNNYTRDRIKDRRESDEEDVVASVMASLFQRMGDGRLAPPENREKFWRLLRSMAKNKSAAVARRTTAQKRGGGEVGGESKFGNQRGGGIDMVPGNRSNDPHKLMESSEQFLSIISSLGSPDLQKVAILRMSNYSNLDIAEKLK